jgi:hypothetical protein
MPEQSSQQGSPPPPDAPTGGSGWDTPVPGGPGPSRRPPRRGRGGEAGLGAPWMVLGFVGVLVAGAALGFALLGAPGVILAGPAVATSVPGRAVTPTTAAVPGSTRPLAARADVGAVGDTASITVDGAPAGEITVTKARTAAREAGFFGERPGHGRFLIVSVAVQATGDRFDINRYDFYVRGAGGTQLDEQCCAYFGKELEAATLDRGEGLRGVLVFDVGPGRPALVYAPNPDGAPVAEWQL